MEGWIPTKRLKKVVEFSDKFCGNVEPIHRYLYLYFDKFLKVSITDGCAVADIFFSKEFFPFKKVYKISIQHLKGLLKGFDEKKSPVVRMLALDEGLKMDLENMSLNVKAENEEKPSFNLKNPILISKIQLKKFLNNLDFCSITSMEGDLVNIFTNDKKELWGWFHGYNMGVYTCFGKSEVTISRSIPYVTVRHIIKSLSLISDEEISLYLNESDILIKGKGMNINLCSSIDPVRIKVNFDKEFLEYQKINLKELKRILNKIYTSLPSNTRIYLIFGKESYILAEDKNTTITWKIDLKFKYKYLIEINPRKLRSVFSRINENVIIKLNNKKVLFQDNQNYLEIGIKEFSK
ncbi:hypothetical protein X275_08695 [Marinitoga sp. 1197]|uniref:hypothetical protein n=1 Tax=Marinitoga sp. 1197 TaxID=1428449 RepID=UPI000641002F|nr:hypothetical protein [Marinitoga sp. 1197]KLO21578.1 hypothetical protein X275_08695 [Marinitoga sp. 1197]